MSTAVDKLAALERECIGGEYRVVKPLGRGSFGIVYQGIDVARRRKVAIKVEPYGEEEQLEYEYQIYRCMAGTLGVPKAHWLGAEWEHNVMVLDLLGPSLEDLFSACDRKFSLKTVLLLADQLILRLRDVHARNYVHRDLKPANLLMGTGSNQSVLYLIDFGLALPYRSQVTGEHFPSVESCGLAGTARYASVNAHNGLEQSRRDDLESAGYILLYLTAGSLPWQGVSQESPSAHLRGVARIKQDADLFAFCAERAVPQEFATAIQYARNLGYTEAPDYDYVCELYRSVFRAHDFPNDQLYDWTINFDHPPSAKMTTSR